VIDKTFYPSRYQGVFRFYGYSQKNNHP